MVIMLMLLEMKEQLLSWRYCLVEPQKKLLQTQNQMVLTGEIPVMPMEEIVELERNVHPYAL